MATGLMASTPTATAPAAMTPTTPALASSIYDPTTSAPNPSQETGTPQSTNGGYGNYVNQAVQVAQPPTALNPSQGSVAPADSGVSQGALSQLMSPASSAGTQAASGTSTGTGIADSINQFGEANLGTGAGLNSSGLALASSGAAPALSEGTAVATAAGEPGISVGTLGSIGGESADGALAYGATAADTGALTATSLTGIASGVGVGALAGQFIAGLTGGNTMGASIGGAIGGGIGAAAMGTAAFSAIATSLGAFAGPIGIAAGAVLGSVIGGMFGAKPTDGTEVQGLALATGKVNPIYQNTQSDTGAKYSATNAGVASYANTGASNLAQYLIANGASPNGNIQDNNPNLVIKAGSRDGIQIGTQNESTGNGSGAPSAPVYTTTLPANATQAQIQQAVNQTVMSLYSIPPALQSQLQNVDMSNFYGSADGTGNVSQGGPGIPLISAPSKSSASTSTPAIASSK